MAALLGLDAKLYRLSTGTRATWGSADSDGIHESSSPPAALDEVPNVRDLTLNMEQAQADVTTRGNNGWRASLATLKDASVEFQMVYDSDDPDFTAMQAAWLLQTAIAFAVLNGDKATVGTEGLWADFMVFNFSVTQNLEEAQLVNVTLRPTYSAVAPEWVRVTA